MGAARRLLTTVREADQAVSIHRPVMLQATLAGLAVRPGGIYLDGTFGRGGHSSAILEALQGQGMLYAFDRDPEAATFATGHFGRLAYFEFHQGNFRDLGRWAEEKGLCGRIAGIVLDLGVSSPQLDQAERGFSFQKDGPLDMRMDSGRGLTAAEWLARAREEEIAEVLWRLGEERQSRRIARAIVSQRAETPLSTTLQLASLVAAVPGPRSHRIHPATRTFQAIRMFVNGELDALTAALDALPTLLAPGGRAVIISFHSLEDRLVKRRLRDGARGDAPVWRLIERAQFAETEEVDQNPRSRSAVLRVAERLP